MALANKQFHTIEDIYALPEGNRAELIDGIIYDMAPPSGTHQRISMQLSTDINNYIRGKRGGCQVFAAPYAVFLNDDGFNYVEPDISVICDPDKLDDKGCHGAPDWIIEIVSTSSRQMDYFVKLFKYRSSGVREYWIVNPKDESVIVYDFVRNTMEKYSFSDIIPVGIYPDLSITVQI